MRRLLMIAYHFPPLAGSSGIQRTLRFVQHLPANGWHPMVLTTHVAAYERTDPASMVEVPPGVRVERAWALDTARHLSVRGRYVGRLAIPDRWMTWRFDAVRRGLALIRAHRPDVLWSTYPIATAHLIGAELHRRSGVPWVADFRDPMAQEDYPEDPATWKAYEAIEQRAMAEAACCVFATAGAADEYRARYGPRFSPRIEVVENGYDESSFVRADGASRQLGTDPNHVPLLLHSGIVYPAERDPTALFDALGRLRQSGWLTPDRLRIRFRAPVHASLLEGLARRAGVEDIVEIGAHIGYTQALREMLDADALLVLQSAGCNQQIPAKAYEYLRTGRQIVCLSDPAGDTVRMLRAAGVRAIARLDSPDEIAELLVPLVERLRRGERDTLVPEFIRAASRERRASQLAGILDRVVAGR